VRRRRLPRGAWVDAEGGVNVPMRMVWCRDWPLHRRLWGRARMSWARRRRYPDQLHWWIRAGGWVLVAAPLGLVPGRPWLAAAGPFVFEAGWWLFELRRARALRRGHPWSGWDDGDGAGDREPRVPSPLAGAGAVALDLPLEERLA
jgi:hypothetical protein